MRPLKQLRLALGVPVDSLAKAAAISIEAYWDLENDEHELDEALSVRDIARLAKKLGVVPSALFGGASTGVVTTEALAQEVHESIARRRESIATFEDRVGWDVADALAAPPHFLTFNADGLRAVCAEVGIDWLNVLDGIDE